MKRKIPPSNMTSQQKCNTTALTHIHTHTSCNKIAVRERPHFATIVSNEILNSKKLWHDDIKDSIVA